MASIAIKLSDPTGQSWAQLVDPTLPLSELLPTFVERLGLPEQLDYELLNDSGEVLPAADSLRELGIIAGANLSIRPKQNRFFKTFMEELYDEAVSEARDQLWDAVRDRLETIDRLDPAYPDAEQLWKQVGSAAVRGKTRAGSTKKDARAASREDSPDVGRSASTPPGTGAPKQKPQPKPSANAAAVPRQGGSFFGRIFFLLIVVVIGGGLLIYFEVIPEPDWLPEWFPRQAVASETTLVNGVTVGTGDVRVTLTWNTGADLDLYVTDPSGEEIFFGNRRSGSGGELDVDAKAQCSAGPGVENIFWPTNGAPTGVYQVAVRQFDNCGAGTTRFEVSVFVNGQLDDTYARSLESGTAAVTLPNFRR